ncbi:MAG: hypothetical protein ACO3AW_01080 [Chitinophagaceae bacterium]
MKSQQEQLEALKDIRKIMERSSRFSSLSGLSGVLIGLYALIGVAIFCIDSKFSPLEKGYYHLLSNTEGGSDTGSLSLLILIAGSVLLLSLITGTIMSLRKSKKIQEPIWDKTSRRMLTNMLIPLITGGIFILVLLTNNLVAFLAPVSLIFYGLSLVNASKYTIEDIRYLGVIEIILGLSSAWWIDLGLINWTIGFGILHITYGLFLHSKHEK